MSEKCPTCGVDVEIKGNGTTHYYEPLNAHEKTRVKDLLKIKELEEKIKELEKKNETN